MDFLTHNALYIELQDKTAGKADEELLKKKKPDAAPFSKKYFDEDLKHKEVLWALIEVATEKEILENRGKGKKNEDTDPQTKEEIEARIEVLEEKINNENKTIEGNVEERVGEPEKLPDADNIEKVSDSE